MNDQEILKRAAIILNEEEDFLIPTLKLYELLQDEIEDLSIDPEHLISLLDNHENFEIIDSKSTMEPWEDDDDDEMQALGFYKGPRVMLKSKTPSKEELMQSITEKMQNTLNSLKSAYNVKPENLTDDEEVEFMEVMKKVKNLQKKLDDINGQTE